MVCVTEYGVSLSVLAITEVKQRRARSIIEWMTAWDCQYQVLYALGHACSDVVLWGSENHVNQMACLTELYQPSD